MFNIILSFYLLALAVMPCRDKDDCKHRGSGQYTFSNFEHSEHDHEAEHCSPLCMCVCCGQSIINTFYPIALYNLTPIAVLDFPIYNPFFVPEVFLSIWQPPKISC